MNDAQKVMLISRILNEYFEYAECKQSTEYGLLCAMDLIVRSEDPKQKENP